MQETREGGGITGTGMLDAPPDRVREAVSRRRAAYLRGRGEQFPTRVGDPGGPQELMTWQCVDRTDRMGRKCVRTSGAVGGP